MIEVRMWIQGYLIKDAENGLAEMEMDGNVHMYRSTTGSAYGRVARYIKRTKHDVEGEGGEINVM